MDDDTHSLGWRLQLDMQALPVVLPQRQSDLVHWRTESPGTSCPIASVYKDPPPPSLMCQQMLQVSPLASHINCGPGPQVKVPPA
ncbi:hypothetical protein LMH87_011640 [Akanthomyces muscarius]|uniref:Uncharacterized protein n=1 Tax=Akanthomyces muscarius TaxID=2231603 RepID=A0A9W8QCX8_AKAMU|nr:hypothetical protein LMH87_011640 [Akanthomyces muscarius]KAJ4150913.1 hypothetical protein LMH87_011640 [Akanthomyces muscarius]